MRTAAKKTRVFWPLLLAVLLTDCTTKRAAVESLSPAGTQHEVIGETVRLSLAYNDRGAMGVPVGVYGRKALGLFAILVSGGFFIWYRRANDDDALLAATASLFIAGALGNGWGRMFSERGVVDFIDLGVGSYRFWTFNVADVALTGAAALLLIVSFRAERKSKVSGPAF